MCKKMPLVTVILPVYNGAHTLKATINSLLKQTFTNFELLIGIDGTKDESKSISEAFDDDRITVFENEINLGLAQNLNKLIALSHKDSVFIAIAEQDDVYVPQRLQWQVEVMQQHADVGLVSGIAEFKSDSGRVLFPGLLVRGEQFVQGENLFRFLYINQLKVVNTCMMFRKKVHLAHQLVFKNTYGNFNTDWDYVLRFSLVSTIYGIPKKLVTMDRGLANNSVTRNKVQQHKASRELLKDFIVEFPKLITKADYKSALKTHRKIELGHHFKTGIVCYSIYYFLLYTDVYFLKYLVMRIRKFKNKKVIFNNDFT